MHYCAVLLNERVSLITNRYKREPIMLSVDAIPRLKNSLKNNENINPFKIRSRNEKNRKQIDKENYLHSSFS